MNSILQKSDQIPITDKMGRTLKILLFLLLIIVGNCYAQTGTIFDTNCKSFATDKNNILVKGRLESDMRTERYFNWDNITPNYKEYLNKVTVIVQKHPGIRPEQMYLKENKPVADTNTFKSYCVESIAKRGIQEELDKWTVHAQNCMNEKIS